MAADPARDQLEPSAGGEVELDEEVDAVAAGPGERPALPVALRSRASALRCVLGATGVWLVTIAPIVAAGGSSVGARVLAALTILPGVGGPLLLQRNTHWARHVGLSAFVGLSAITWVLAASDGVLPAIDTFRAVLGAVAWGAFALSWSHPWSVPEPDLTRAPEGATAGLKPRRQPPAYAGGVAVVGAAAAAACLALAWGISDPNRAVLAQAVAVGSAIALLTAASTVSAIAGRDWGRKGRASASLPIDRRVVSTLLLMLLLAAVGVAIYLSQG